MLCIWSYLYWSSIYGTMILMVEFNLIDTTVYSLPSNNRSILFSGNPCFFKDRRIDMKPLVSFVKKHQPKRPFVNDQVHTWFVFPVVFHRFCTYCANKANNKTIGEAYAMFCYIIICGTTLVWCVQWLNKNLFCYF